MRSRVSPRARGTEAGLFKTAALVEIWFVETGHRTGCVTESLPR
jgi:hypothetical protein